MCSEGWFCVARSVYAGKRSRVSPVEVVSRIYTDQCHDKKGIRSVNKVTEEAGEGMGP